MYGVSTNFIFKEISTSIQQECLKLIKRVFKKLQNYFYFK